MPHAVSSTQVPVSQLYVLVHTALMNTCEKGLPSHVTCSLSNVHPMAADADLHKADSSSSDSNSRMGCMMTIDCWYRL